MKNILVIGSTGQIGSELTMKLRRDLPGGTTVAGYIPGAEPKGALLSSGPAEEANVCNAKQIADIVDKYDIDTIYNLAALLSATAERLPLKAWDIQMNGLINILEIAREKRCAVFTPSSIGSFGPSTPREDTPQDTIQRPTTMYGVTKVATELLSDYYFHRFGVDTRSVRFPGLISYTTLPGGGTTDYAVEIYYAAVKGEEFICPIAPGTYMDMMYMPDALKAAVDIMRAKPRYLKHRNAFNIASMSLEPEEIAASIRKYIPDFKMRYEVDPIRQHIADSWPDRMDDTCARKEWGWSPSFDLDSMTRDMLEHLRTKLQ
ncbi:MAG: NAD-dependent epimerase/dehydratase family protein [Candidatus Cryptobacteroides sp.]|nr:NAD-dependent epimerase/dehydratase family protein [Candidatus Cryptobacteroides sp.]